MLFKEKKFILIPETEDIKRFKDTRQIISSTKTSVNENKPMMEKI
jgi:hypothetical protein